MRRRSLLSWSAFLALCAVLGPAGGVLLSQPARAHHSFAMFDMTKRVTLEGTVKSFEWTNPHTWIYLEVANDKGGVDVWQIEGLSPNFLGRRGWSRTTFKPGDKVTIAISPLKSGEKGGAFSWAKLPSGKYLTINGFADNPPPAPPAPPPAQDNAQ